MHPHRQLGIADSPLGLEQGKNAAIYCVKFGHSRSFFEIAGPRQKELRGSERILPQLRNTFQPAGGRMVQTAKGREP